VDLVKVTPDWLRRPIKLLGYGAPKKLIDGGHFYTQVKQYSQALTDSFGR
jgi:hypothetical protein